MSSERIKSFLQRIGAASLPDQGQTWLQEQLGNLHAEKDFYLAFSRTPRFTGRLPLQLTAADVEEAKQLQPGFNLQNWTTDQVARTLLVLAIPHNSPEEYISILNKVFSTADLSELATLYAALPLLPYPEMHVKRAAEGVRTTMTQVFDAIALNNAYPHDFLPEEAWNQMVLKSIFNVRPLYQIYGLDARRNQALAHIAIDYAHERWAAGRTLTPELWRLVGPFLTPETLKDVKRLLQSPETIQQEAAVLTLSESSLPEAKALLEANPELRGNLKNLTWDYIGQRTY